jgi:tryptophan-rich sensory protein
MSKTLTFISSIGLCLAMGALGSIFTAPAIQGWYGSLIKPSFNPPDWVFGPVWTLLYILMGIALYLVLIKGKDASGVKKGVQIFLIQLMLNVAWSYLFFYLKSPFYAFLEILLLWAAIFLTMRQFKKLDIRAVWLLVPYILWVSFAAFLNYTIWRLNI